jgi:uncharacterized protein YjbJ (UPF0337 family)
MNWLVDLRKIGTKVINGAPLSLPPKLRLHTAGASALQAERRAGFRDGVRMKRPEPTLHMTELHASPLQCDYVLTVIRPDAASVGTAPSATVFIEDEINERWMQQIGSARQSWSRLTDSELQASKGIAEKLIALIQLRYSISADDATKRVKCFFDKQQS